MTLPIAIQKHLRGIANPEIAHTSQRFFKTAPGQYGEGDIFLGIKVPTLRFTYKRIPGYTTEYDQFIAEIKISRRTLICTSTIDRFFPAR
jgi:hypothetical protein